MVGASAVTLAVILLLAHTTAAPIEPSLSSLSDSMLIKAVIALKAKQILKELGMASTASTTSYVAPSVGETVIVSGNESTSDSTPMLLLPAPVDVINDPLLQLVYKPEKVINQAKPIDLVPLNKENEDSDFLMQNKNDLIEENAMFTLSGRRKGGMEHSHSKHGKHRHHKKNDYSHKKKKKHQKYNSRREDKLGLSLEKSEDSTVLATTKPALTTLKLQKYEALPSPSAVEASSQLNVIRTGKPPPAANSKSSSEEYDLVIRPNDFSPPVWHPTDHTDPTTPPTTTETVKRPENYRPLGKADMMESMYDKLLKKNQALLHRLKKQHHNAHAHAHAHKPKLRANAELIEANLDLSPGTGQRVLAMQMKGRVCQRHVLMPEGPKYNKFGRSYVAEFERKPGYPDYPSTKARVFMLPACCNCCEKSVLGCE